MPGDLSHLSFAEFVYNQLFVTLPEPTTSFKGKTVIVTGSNSGLGLEAARIIVRLGASKLIIAVRSTEKGEKARRETEQSTNCASSVIEVWSLDLGSYASVKAFAERVNRDLPQLDVLLENAGIATAEFVLAEDNESTVTVNVVSTFLLAFLLLPKLKDSASNFNIRPNLTIVSSEVHGHVDFNEKSAPVGIFNNLNDKSKADMANRHPTSKLLEVFIVREMAEQKPMDSYPVTINMLNPGLCQSELAREGDLGVRIMKFLIGRTTEAGSRNLVWAACAGKETHGQYMSECKVAEQASISRKPEGQKAQKKLWSELIAKLEMIQPGVSANL